VQRLPVASTARCFLATTGVVCLFNFGADEESNGVFEIVCALWRRLDLLFGFRRIVIRYCKFSFVSPAFASFFFSVSFFFGRFGGFFGDVVLCASCRALFSESFVIVLLATSCD